MSFVTVTFAVFLAAVFCLHWAFRHALWQRLVLLLASYLFYGWWDWRFCGLLLISSTTGFLVARALASTTQPTARRRLLAVSLVVDLGILGFFKYFNFFADSVAVGMTLLGVDVSTTSINLVLPVGISFYTFQSLAYVIDVYRGREAERDPAVYFLYLGFFPQLVAGPIERAHDLLGQLRVLRRFDLESAVSGCRLALWGLLKKTVFADPLGEVADAIFARGTSASGPEILLGILAFSFQIYGDFSGYSDMAAGIARLFGIQLSRNFNRPYFARDLSEFWQRWHITLSSWLRDYVFIPLGGSRGALHRTLRNLLLTFLLSGLWHGAAWHFVVWGGWHATGLIAHHLWQASPRPPFTTPPARFPSPLREGLHQAATFTYVCLGWIWFRASDLGEAGTLFGRLVWGWERLGLAELNTHAWVLVRIPLWLGIEWLGKSRWDPIAWERVGPAWRWCAYTGAVWCFLLFGSRRIAEFIYFQF